MGILRRRKCLDLMSSIAFLALMAASVVWLSSHSQVAHDGVPRVIDGDSLSLDGVEIRLQGIDAPEIGQVCSNINENYDCGRAARNHLRNLIDGQTVKCNGWQHDKFDRLLAVCSTDKHELNRLMVRDGWAVSYGSFSSEEAAAKKSNTGIWQGDFQSPQTWREHKRDLEETRWIDQFKFW